MSSDDVETMRDRMAISVQADDETNPPTIAKGNTTLETLSQKGAMDLARRLQEYWHVRGYKAARFWAVPIEERFDKIGTYQMYSIQSNLLNGLPPD